MKKAGHPYIYKGNDERKEYLMAIQCVDREGVEDFLFNTRYRRYQFTPKTTTVDEVTLAPDDWIVKNEAGELSYYSNECFRANFIKGNFK